MHGLGLLYQSLVFLSTPSARRATLAVIAIHSPIAISIHALCEEGDCLAADVPNSGDLFLSTPSARRATALPRSPPQNIINFYPRPLRGGRRFPLFLHPVRGHISIHALCEEGDLDSRGISW